MTNASVMRMTAIHIQTERKQQNRSARCDEKHRCRDRTRRFRGLICPVSVACAPTGAAQDEKRLSSAPIKALLASNGTPLGGPRKIYPGIRPAVQPKEGLINGGGCAEITVWPSLRRLSRAKAANLMLSMPLLVR